MTELNSFVRDVERAIASGDLERCKRTLRNLTNLFVEHSAKLNEDHVSVFDEVIGRLAREADALARSDLSASLAEIANAPTRTVKDLAHDDNVRIAQPVLERSARLTEDDLVEIAAKQDQEHLLAISRRAALSERVTETLVDRGDQRVIRAIAENGGAKLSQKGIAVLAEKAQGSIDLLEALQKRSDVPPEVRRMWTGKAAPKPAVQQPKAASSVDMRRIEAAIAQVAQSAADPSQPPPPEIAPALKHVAKLARGKPIDEVRVVAWIKAGRNEDALAALAHNARLPADTVATSYAAASFEPLLLVVRAARLNWNTFKLLLAQKLRAAPPADVVKTSFEIFQQVPVETAAELVGRIASGQVASQAP